MYCIIDTETSGLFDFSRPADGDGQPRLASIAMLATDRDLNLLAATFVLVAPDGWCMSAEAERINGLSLELLVANGVPVLEVLTRYAAEIDRGCTIVAHNAQFDTKMLRGEMRRAGLDDRYRRTSSICTMRALTDICQLPKPSGRGFKFPKLAEAVRFCLGREPSGAHGALHDAMDCLDLMRWLKREGRLPEPQSAAA